jgi:REP element-mobilizing transposase RayT
MPRGARRKSDSGIYHIMLRGFNRQTIFLDDEDCEKYLQCLEECKAISGFTLYAYCLMGNHIHLLIKEDKEPLELIFKRVGARYVFWYNWKYKRSGHLFQDRYKSEAVEDDAYFLTVLRYIYQKPVKAGFCRKPAEYRWSSFRSLGTESLLADHSRILNMMTAEQFKAFVETPAEDKVLDLTPDVRLTDREAAEIVKETCKIRQLSDFSTISPEKQGAYIRCLHEKGCSIRQVSRLTGISKARIEKILSQ